MDALRLHLARRIRGTQIQEVKPSDASALANPIGLDGVFQAHCPPYFPTMDAAVDTVLRPLLKNRPDDVQPGHAPGSVPYLISDAQYREGEVEISEAGIACTKSICNYIYETYGRFPGSLDAMHLMWFMQAHIWTSTSTTNSTVGARTGQLMART